MNRATTISGTIRCAPPSFAALATGLLCAHAASVCLAQGETAPAQSSQGTLEEIVVTANKRAENLQSVPIAIAAITAEQFSRANITSTSEITMMVPGLNLQVGNLNFSPYIRGVGTTAANAGADNSVQTYVDGVLISAYTAGLSALNNIEQIEVAKGPQGTLFGRNTTGGVINITTKTPDQQFRNDTALSYGNFETVTFNQYTSGGLTPSLAADIAAYISYQGEGWGKNLNTGSEVYKERSRAVRSKWVWNPGANDTLTFSADYSEILSSVYAAETPVPGRYTNWGPGSVTAAERPDMAAGVASGAILPTFVVGLPVSHPGGSPYNVSVAVDPYSKWWGGGASAKWIHEFGPVSLSYIGAYRSYREDVIWSPSPTPGVQQIAGWGNGTKALTQELNVQSASSAPVQWVAGVFYLDNSVEYTHPFFIEGSSINGVTVPGVGFSRVNFYGEQTTESYAVYGQATIPLSFVPGTKLTLGARYTRDDKEIDGDVTFNTGPLYLGFYPPADVDEIAAGDIAGDDSFNKTTYRVALSHDITADVMAYVSYNTGFKSGGYNMIPPSPQAYNPEELQAWEVGLKTELFDRRLRVNPSAFLYDWSDLQVTVYENTAAVTVNAAKARIYGLDLDFQAMATDRLMLTGGFSWLKSEFTEYPNATFNIAQSQQQGGGTIAQVASAKGNKLPYAPDLTVNFGVDYRAPIAAGEVGVNVTAFYSDGFFTTADNFIGQDSYQLVNARLEWTLPDGRTTFGLWGKNLTDELYATLVRANNNPGGFTVRNLGAPRTYGVSARYEF